MTHNFIDIKHQDCIVEIRLNQPQKRNPLSMPMISELTSAFEDARDSEALAIIIAANGPVFCAGHDFNDMLDQNLSQMRKLMHACSTMMQFIHSLPQLVIAKVQGPALGAGCQLALTCDMVVASTEASFRTAGGSSGWFCFTPMVAVTRAVGRKRALEMLMTGDLVGAEQASEWGMINRVVSPERLDEETEDLARRASRGSRLLRAIGKHAFYTQIDLDEARAYEYATEMMSATGIMADPQERMRAFVEKRTPVFTHE